MFQYSRETESMVTSARAKDRQNLFKVYPNLNVSIYCPKP